MMVTEQRNVMIEIKYTVHVFMCSITKIYSYILFVVTLLWVESVAEWRQRHDL